MPDEEIIENENTENSVGDNTASTYDYSTLEDWLSNKVSVNESVIGDVKRKRTLYFLRKKSDLTGMTDAQKVSAWQWLGYKQESLATANNYDEEEMEDVRGDVWNDIVDKNENIDMSECRINKDHTPFLDTMFKYTLCGIEEYLEDYEILFVYDWLNAVSNKQGYETAEKLCRLVSNVTATLDNLGNQSFTTADVNLSGISEGEIGRCVIVNGKPQKSISNTGAGTMLKWYDDSAIV